MVWYTFSLFSRLSVVSNNITDEGLVALAHAMQANTTLTHIYIWGNKIGTNASVVSGWF